MRRGLAKAQEKVLDKKVRQRPSLWAAVIIGRIEKIKTLGTFRSKVTGRSDLSFCYLFLIFPFPFCDGKLYHYGNRNGPE